MKHILLFLAAFLMVTLVSAQSGFSILDENGNDITGKTITVSSKNHDEPLLSALLKIKNTGTTDLTLYVARTNNIVVNGSSNSFCFGGNCYIPTIDTSLNSTTVAAGVTDDSFTGDYYPSGALGVSSVTYSFFDPASSPVISASVTVNFAIAAIELFDEADHRMNDSVLVVESSDTSLAATISATLKVKNNSGAPLEMYVRRITNSAVQNTSNAFCFGICYSPFTDTSTVKVNLENGQIDNQFISDYYPASNGGTTSLTFDFFDSGAFGIPLHASCTIEFTLKGVGMPEKNKLAFGDAYPNPASASTSISYSLPGSSSQAYISIRNLLGSEIDRVMLKNSEGKAVINTSAYPAGMYLYTLVFNNSESIAKKLIIK